MQRRRLSGLSSGKTRANRNTHRKKLPPKCNDHHDYWPYRNSDMDRHPDPPSVSVARIVSEEQTIPTRGRYGWTARGPEFLCALHDLISLPPETRFAKLAPHSPPPSVSASCWSVPSPPPLRVTGRLRIVGFSTADGQRPNPMPAGCDKLTHADDGMASKLGFRRRPGACRTQCTRSTTSERGHCREAGIVRRAIPPLSHFP